MLRRLRPHRLTSWLIAIALVTATSPSQAQLFNSPVDQLPVADRVTLRNGKAVVTGEKGRYTAKILVNTSPEAAWAVLTDYNNFARFLPNVSSSKLLEDKGVQKVVEQVDVRSVLFVTVRSRILSSITEQKNQRIDFRRIEGDLPKLEGFWLLEPVAPYSGAKADQVLITQVVEVQPSTGAPENVFYNIFKNSLRDNLVAIHKEIDRRTPAKL